ncbi:hypothetical protein LVO79_06885 [Roseivivax marinus]|uniref:hypothetical protein n=1 Tax=Roseivivax marinus TaxID=1379903 RepID=UPI001F03781C|nr:hypothetical protein [Roseivivax marinus]UMA66163.1 hypothetical protein LVO79_06885 [Roseivivax marinus]
MPESTRSATPVAGARRDRQRPVRQNLRHRQVFGLGVEAHVPSFARRGRAACRGQRRLRVGHPQAADLDPEGRAGQAHVHLDPFQIERFGEQPAGIGLDPGQHELARDGRGRVAAGGLQHGAAAGPGGALRAVHRDLGEVDAPFGRIEREVGSCALERDGRFAASVG